MQGYQFPELLNRLIQKGPIGCDTSIGDGNVYVPKSSQSCFKERIYKLWITGVSWNRDSRSALRINLAGRFGSNRSIQVIQNNQGSPFDE